MLPPVGLVTLDEALAPYPHTSKKTLRALISTGKLAASKVGKHLYVARADVDEVFRPRVRAGKIAPVAQAVVASHGLSACPKCGDMSSPEHQAVCEP